ncbi:hypothetical protein BCR44DRAFT_1424927 [Catenaria anguillulae PL171]|uniref:Uncharacterized protein n=1 Tax=Catenaria anguillulae PL171 TaxID=765915 RepID=A0A1Y2HB88_9FUNG|nr:hypothetical protein BCR44DRAFT_1444006 [Catenaria anguillulae PL171]ORZ30953.1 hypothetical protein BCR44DRAFT_1443546 [Catenaria anguillulae PL171]ORZ34825.1 hypothetical protein BCR44DRAFT_1435883 [Catenaria anguillulae PL171]ORZ40378.1 hypothetical protein BCR44DRAFT_1424927 [Catenaria anguillulae PL171]
MFIVGSIPHLPDDSVLASQMTGSKERETKANAIAAYFLANPQDRLLQAVVDGLRDVYHTVDVFAAKKCGLAVSEEPDDGEDENGQQEGGGEDEGV